ncbi:MAG: AsmA family protein [Acidobacteria bacterium]|nr:AsmA family protein [Acidobacteriota bacterium]
MAKGVKIGLTVVACAILGLCAAAWYTVHNPDRYVPEAITYLQKKTGLQIEIQHVSVRLLPLSVRLYGVAVKNPKPFPQGYFLQAPEVDAAIPWMPLLHGHLIIRSVVVEKPVIHLISDPDGLWNFQNPSSTNKEPPQISMGSISSLQIKNGTLYGSGLIDPSDAPGPLVFTAEDFSGGLQQLDGAASKHPSPRTSVVGSLTVGTVIFGRIHLREVHSQVQVEPAQFTFKNFEAKTYRGHAAGDFSFDFSGSRTRFDTDLRVSGVGINYLLAEFETGQPKITGMMEADMKLNGIIEHSANPLSGIHGTGHFIIRKGELTGLNGNKSMAQMARFRDPGTSSLPVSAFSSFSGDLDLDRQRIDSRQINVDFYGIDVDGSGSVDELNSRLDYKGKATIETKQGFFISAFARLFKGAESQHGRLVFPMRVTGTLNDPKCSVVD